jgi:DNA-binding beta-propeller fold protein YncE
MAKVIRLQILPPWPKILTRTVRAALAGIVALAFVSGPFHGAARAADSDVPLFVVDPYWPKPLPNRWVTGSVGGVCVDRQDHVFGVNRSDLTAMEQTVGKQPAPVVIEYDSDGNMVSAWGDPKLMPKSTHGCFVDKENNIWIGGNADGIVQKWSHDGKQLLLQIGRKGVCDNPAEKCGEPGGNSSPLLLNEPADIAVDPESGDVYVADGYGNHRVVVFDAQGKFLRQWGDAGTDRGLFAVIGGGHPHCAKFDREGLLYVCDRGNDRIEVFDKTGTLKRVIDVKPGTAYSPAPDGAPGRKAIGSALDVAFSADPEQKYMYVVDTGNEVLWILDHQSGRILGGFGSAGHNAGEFTLLHMIAVDSKGALYTSETIDGRRLQKFVPNGFVPEEKLNTYVGSPRYDALPTAK